MSMRYLLTTTLLFLSAALWAQTPDIESRYKAIDQAIAESPRYVAQREAKIASARHAFESATGRQKYEEGYKLYARYRP